MTLVLHDFLPKNQFPDITQDVFDQQPFHLGNFIGAQWEYPEGLLCNTPNPLSQKTLIYAPYIWPVDLGRIAASMNSCPPYGLHNPLYRRERYVEYGKICARAADTLASYEVADYFAKLINVVIPKGYEESMGEVTVVRDFLYNLAGDGCRNLAEGFMRPGNRTGQEACGYRWPYGPVAIITPFNFPLEIPALQLMGALAMGNKPLLKPDSRVAPVAEAFVRLLLACGMPSDDMCLLHADGRTTEHMMKIEINDKPLIRLIQFTGSTKIANRLLRITKGRVKVEDSGFDWKILGPHFLDEDIDPIAQQCDKDAYAASGQKCSAQSFLLVHTNWTKAGLLERLAELARMRTIENLSIGPILTWSNQRITNHIKKLLTIRGARVLFGGMPAKKGPYIIPSEYGCFEPTAVHVPLQEIFKNFNVVTKEIFAPVQILTTWESAQDLSLIITILNNLNNHLTAGVVDRNITFIEHVLGRTINGTTYAGILGRTTGAPQWHWFGPAGHPANAGIGTPEAIRAVWSYHREIIKDHGEYSMRDNLLQRRY